jgi:hypothetical protein
MSFEREHQLMAWHKQTLGGVFGASGSPVIEDIAVIPSPEGDRDELYVCVKRTINGATKHYLEYGVDHWDENTEDLEDMFYVDSGVSTSSSTAATLSGLEHLEGQTIPVLRGGRYLGDKLVASGSITLASSTFDTAAAVHAGLSYTAELESLPLAKPGSLSKIIKAFVRFVSSVKANVSGSTSTDRDTRRAWGSRAVNWSFGTVDVSAPTPAQSRIIEIPAEGDKGQEVFFKITHDSPTACTVASWSFDVSVDRA